MNLKAPIGQGVYHAKDLQATQLKSSCLSKILCIACG